MDSIHFKKNKQAISLLDLHPWVSFWKQHRKPSISHYSRWELLDYNSGVGAGARRTTQQAGGRVRVWTSERASTAAAERMHVAEALLARLPAAITGRHVFPISQRRIKGGSCSGSLGAPAGAVMWSVPGHWALKPSCIRHDVTGDSISSNLQTCKHWALVAVFRGQTRKMAHAATLHWIPARR